IGSDYHPINKRLKIVFFDNLPEGKMGHQDDDTHQTVLAAAKLLASMGHIVEQRPFPIEVDFLAHHFLSYYGFLAFFMKDLSRIVLNAKMNKHELENFTTGLSKHFTSNMTKLPSSLRMLKKTGAEVEA